MRLLQEERRDEKFLQVSRGEGQPDGQRCVPHPTQTCLRDLWRNRGQGPHAVLLSFEDEPCFQHGYLEADAPGHHGQEKGSQVTRNRRQPRESKGHRIKMNYMYLVHHMFVFIRCPDSFEKR